MKKILSLSLVALILVSCGAKDTPVEETKKIPFSINTTSFESFPTTYEVQKTGRLTGSSLLSLTAQWVGRVDKVLVREGAIVKKWQTLVLLRDTTANYDLRYSQAANSLSSNKNTRASTEISLDKAVSDAKLSLERAEMDLKTVESQTTLSLEKALRDAQKSDTASATSDATVTLAQLQASLDKSKLDYQNLISSNTQTLKNFTYSFNTSVSDLSRLYTKLLFEGDRLYGITPAFQSENTNIRRFMGTTSLKWGLEFAYFDLQKAAAGLEGLKNITVDETNILTQLDTLATRYQVLKMYLSTTGTYLQASSVGTEFPQSQLDGLLASNNGYKSEAAGLENGWVNFRSSASTFLANYKNNESAAAAGLVVAEKNIEVQKRNLATGSFEADNGLDRIKATNEQSLTSSRIARDSAKSNYENALKNRILTQDRSRLSESDASLALSQAREELDKLTIRSPINGTVTLVQASVGTDVNPGSPMIEIANTNPEVIFDIEASIVPLLKVGSEQTIDYQGKSYTGTVVGLSEVAGANLLYTTRIILAETPPLLGQVATIRLSIPTQYRVLPSSTIRILSESKGELQTFVSGALTPVSVDLGRVIADRMEIITKIDTTTQIVVSDVSNFDPKRSELVQKIISIE